MRYGKHLNPQVPQTQPIPGREADMIKNDAGAYGFRITDWQRLTRFLILGTEGKDYYVSEAKMTFQNLTNVQKCIKEDGTRVVQEIVAISDTGRAIKNDPAIFALAMTIKFGDEPARKAAYAAVPTVCRIGTHLFTLAQALSDLDKGWGRGTKKAFANWFLNKKVDQAAFQAAKYQSRNGWSTADILRLSHPKTTDPAQNALFKWIVDGEVTDGLPEIIQGFEKAKKSTSATEVAKLITQYNLPRECVPTQYMSDVKIWEALLPNLPLTATIRNLGNMTRIGFLAVGSEATKTVVARLQDKEYIKKSRVHPITILLAMKNYQSGRGFKGSNSWTPVQSIVSALDKAFYLAFDNVEATGKNFLIGVDVSPSMTAAIGGDTNLSSSEAAAALAMTIIKTEPNYWVHGFTSQFVDLGMHDNMSLAEVTKRAQHRNWGGTDASVPVQYAIDKKLNVDVFVLITDNESWAGREHVSKLLEKYRKDMNKPNAKMIVLSTRSSSVSVADPNDPNMLDIVGFDTSVPQAISEFVKL